MTQATRISALKHTLLCFLLCSCCLTTALNGQARHYPRPTIALTFDDGSTRDYPGYPAAHWHQRLLATLTADSLQAAFFIAGANVASPRGERLIDSIAAAGHLLANHTWTHTNFGAEGNTAAQFEAELLRTDSLIADRRGYTRLFRFPYLKEGVTRAQVDAYRQVLRKHAYRNGHVTIDASDWYYDGALVDYLRGAGDPDSITLAAFRDAYVAHLLDRAAYYEQLAYELTGRHIPHTLLLHHNLSAALFLDDLLSALRQNGWDVIDAGEAFADPFYLHNPATIPAGESLVYALAKASGRYAGALRYPAEDGRYEVSRLRSAKLLD